MAYFEKVGKIEYEGPASKNPLAFKYYNPTEVVMGKTMKEQLRFAMSYWHTFTYMGNDPFGSATMFRPWDNHECSMEVAKERVHAAFEFMEKAQIPYVPLGYYKCFWKSQIRSWCRYLLQCNGICLCSSSDKEGN